MPTTSFAAIAVDTERTRAHSTLAMFPGQGSQRVSMASHLVQEYPLVAGRVLAEADEVLGLPLAELCTTGDAAELARTEITQPAILATSLAVLEVLCQEGGFIPSAVAGHSLGEYTALVAARVLTTADALRLVRRRGELMAEVSKRIPGAMAAIMGLGADRVEELCVGGTGDHVVEVANRDARGGRRRRRARAGSRSRAHRPAQCRSAVPLLSDARDRGRVRRRAGPVPLCRAESDRAELGHRPHRGQRRRGP
jgi:[acyl-carrier-protein] S-malonyltransferase